MGRSFDELTLIEQQGRTLLRHIQNSLDNAINDKNSAIECDEDEDEDCEEDYFIGFDDDEMANFIDEIGNEIGSGSFTNTFGSELTQTIEAAQRDLVESGEEDSWRYSALDIALAAANSDEEDDE